MRGNDIGALGFLEGMATQHLLAHSGRMFRVLLQQINQSMSIGTVQSIGILVARHRDLFHILTQLNPRLAIDLDQLVDTTQGRLSLTGNCIGKLNLLLKVSLSRFHRELTQMRANAKAIDLMTLLVQAEYGILVDVVGGDNGQLVEPWYLETIRYLLESLTRQTRQIGQVTRIDAYTQCMIAQIVQSQCNGAEVQ